MGKENNIECKYSNISAVIIYFKVDYMYQHIVQFKDIP